MQTAELSSSRSIRSIGWDNQLGLDGWHQPYQHHEHHHAHGIPIGHHIELIKPVAVPVVKNIGKYQFKKNIESQFITF